MPKPINLRRAAKRGSQLPTWFEDCFRHESHVTPVEGCWLCARALSGASQGDCDDL